MARIVIITSGIASIRNANVELARRLVAAGHHVTYASPDPIEDAVTAQGLPFVQLRATQQPANPPHLQRAAKLGTWLANWRTLPTRREQALAALGVDQFADHVQSLKPDLFLVDVELHEYVIAAAASGVPLALLSNWISLDKRPNVPPLHREIVPGQGRGGSWFGIEAAWLRYRLWKRLQLLLQWLRAGGASPAAVLRHYARQCGFPFRTQVDFDQWLLPFSYRTIPVLCLNAYEFDLPHQPGPHYHYIGAMIQLDRRERNADRLPAAEAEELEALLARHAAAPNPRPLVYCAFGAFFKGDDRPFVRRVLAAVAGCPEWDVVIGLGGRMTADELGPLPAHVHVFPWVPQLRVLERTDCAVIHGGISSINECIQYGVPMLTYPFKKITDQQGNAARIAYHRLGIVGDRDTHTPERIRTNIARILEDESYSAAVFRMRAHFQRYAGEQRAESLVAMLVDNVSGHSTVLRREDVGVTPPRPPFLPKR
jgi:UDP:flavonoid glycosyltransferase YjiC (YdhE family)